MNAIDLERLAAYSDSVRDSTLKRLRGVPEGKENVSSPSGAMSCADIAHHLIRSDEIFLSLTKTKFKDRNLGSWGEGTVPDRKSFEGLISRLDALKLQRRQFILEQDDASLSLIVRFEAITGSGERDLGSMIYHWLDHETHHRGALAVYLRVFDTGL